MRTGSGSRGWWRSGIAAVVAAAVVVTACSEGDDDASEPAAARDGTSSTTVPRPEPPAVTVTGPVTGGNGLANAALQDLAAVGYVEEEYFVEGDASSYALDGDASTDGAWAARPAGTAPFRTRIIVRRPASAGDFSGVVAVEWLNVSAGRDGDPDWGYLHDELIREGHAWVGVSAQAVGVVGGAGILGDVALAGGLAGSDPARYGTLAHPGDAYAFDIYTHAGAAVRRPDGPAPLGDLEPEHVVAVGESQSAIFLTTYVNAVHPLVRVYDGFLVHSRGRGAPSLAGERVDRTVETSGIRIRTDLAEPVLVFATETDLTVLGYVHARQDDTDSVRVWEVAGTAHADAYLIEDVYGVAAGAAAGDILGCAAPLNDGPQHEVLQAAFHHLVAWVRDGTTPPRSPRIEVDTAGAEPVIVRDEHGNARGGIRTPLVDVPVATLSGDPVDGGGDFCFLFGSTTPFDAAKLADLYPTRDDYLAAFRTSADDAVDAGFLLRADADAMIAEAEARDLGR